MFPTKSVPNWRSKMPSLVLQRIVSRRPEETKSPESPFFLAVRHGRKPDDDLIFKQSDGEVQNRHISFKCHGELATVDGRQTDKPFSQKNLHQTLLDYGVSLNSVAQLSGHKNLKRLDSYAVASQQQQRQMSKILSRKENTAKSIEEESIKANQ